MSAEVARRPQRTVAAVNGAVVGVLLVVIVAFGVAVNQSAPPSIAAFAPQLQQQRHTQQQQQSLAGGQAGGGLGAAAPSGAPATPTPAPTPTANAASATPTPTAGPTPNTPAQLLCYGNPPRQTADPASPPCVQSFVGDNGGSTAPGVTGNSIYVAWPDLGGFFGAENETATQDLLAYMNAHFEFYGRKLVLKKAQVTGGSFASNSAQQMQQDADQAAHQANPGIGVFAALAYAPSGGVAYYYDDRLAQDGVVSINSAPLLQTEAHLASSPYLWSTMPSYDTVEVNLANLVCNQLQGRAPAYAGSAPPPATSFGSKRVFAVYRETTTDAVAVDDGPLVARLRQCGAPLPIDKPLDDNSANDTQAVNDMEGGGVTSVICLCSPVQYTHLMNAAANQAFFPEWLVQNEEFQPLDSSGQQYPQQQEGHIIGIDYNDEFLQPQNSFWYQAIRQEDTSYAYSQSGQNVYAYYRYKELMLLAAGIQQAGPHLTAQSFQEGLYATQWSNVGHGQAPYYQAAVGVGPSSHSWLQDAAAVWFNASAQSYTTNQGQVGAFCYSRSGQRSADWSGQPPPVFYGNQSCRGG